MNPTGSHNNFFKEKKYHSWMPGSTFIQLFDPLFIQPYLLVEGFIQCFIHI